MSRKILSKLPIILKKFSKMQNLRKICKLVRKILQHPHKICKLVRKILQNPQICRETRKSGNTAINWRSTKARQTAHVDQYTVCISVRRNIYTLLILYLAIRCGNLGAPRLASALVCSRLKCLFKFPYRFHHIPPLLTIKIGLTILTSI